MGPPKQWLLRASQNVTPQSWIAGSLTLLFSKKPNSIHVFFLFKCFVFSFGVFFWILMFFFGWRGSGGIPGFREASPQELIQLVAQLPSASQEAKQQGPQSRWCLGWGNFLRKAMHGKWDINLPKNRGILPPKMDGENNRKTLFLRWDDLDFLEKQCMKNEISMSPRKLWPGTGSFFFLLLHLQGLGIQRWSKMEAKHFWNFHPYVGKVGYQSYEHIFRMGWWKTTN